MQPYNSNHAPSRPQSRIAPAPDLSLPEQVKHARRPPRTTLPEDRPGALENSGADGLGFLLSAFVNGVGAQSNSESDLEGHVPLQFYQVRGMAGICGSPFRIGWLVIRPVESVRKVAEQKRVNGKTDRSGSGRSGAMARRAVAVHCRHYAPIDDAVPISMRNRY